MAVERIGIIIFVEKMKKIRSLSAIFEEFKFYIISGGYNITIIIIFYMIIINILKMKIFINKF